MRVGECELVEVVDVSDAEVERRDESGGLGGDVGKEVEWHEDGAEEDFFGDGAGDVVAVADPREQRCHGGGGVDAFDDETFEEGAREECERQEEWRDEGGGVNGVPAEEVNGLQRGVLRRVDDESEGGDGGDEASKGYSLDASSDDRRGIPVKGWRGACRRRKVEGEDVEEREGDLEDWKSARHMPRMLVRARRLKAWVWRGGISGNSMLKSGGVFNQGTQVESRSMATLSCCQHSFCGCKTVNPHCDLCKDLDLPEAAIGPREDLVEREDRSTYREQGGRAGRDEWHMFVCLFARSAVSLQWCFTHGRCGRRCQPSHAAQKRRAEVQSSGQEGRRTCVAGVVLPEAG
jgi:hypothetical protein